MVNIRDSGIGSLGLVDNCSDPSQLPSALSTLPSTPSLVALHFHSTLLTLLAPSLVAPSAPLIAPSTPSHATCSCSNSPTAHTSNYSPLGSDTPNRGHGRGHGRGGGRGHGRGCHRRSHSDSPPLVTFPNVPYSFSNPPPFLGNPQGPNFSLRNPGAAYTYFSLFFDDQLLQHIGNQTKVYAKLYPFQQVNYQWFDKTVDELRAILGLL